MYYVSQLLKGLCNLKPILSDRLFILDKEGRWLELLIKQINEIIEGDEIAKDVYLEKTLILRKKTVLNRSLIEKLKRWGIKEVFINKKISIVDQNSPNTKQSADHKAVFYNNLSVVASEQRYGKLLNNQSDIQFMENLFYQILSDQKIVDLLDTLKKWDEYSYYHSFDVFLIGTLLARKFNLSEDIENIGKGYLLHDIGKLKVPKSILQKEGKLTRTEFETIKNHTNQGYLILVSLGFKNSVCQLAKSHHERQDGTGYPEGILTTDFPSSLRILMMVDVYSALTLKRPYREPFPSEKALKFLIEQVNKFDYNYLIQFIEALSIYPKDAIVQLSNNKEAKVIYVKDVTPTIPMVELLDHPGVIELPINYSITITKIVKWYQSNNIENEMISFLNYLTIGDKPNSIKQFELLSDGLRVEEIYTKIICKAMRKIGEMWEEGIITIAEEHIATAVITEIMDAFLEKYVPTNKMYKGNIVLSTIGNEQHTLPIKIIADTLRINEWNVYNLSLPLPKEDLLTFILKNNIKYVGFSLTMKDNIPLLIETIFWLKERCSNIIIMVGGNAIQDISLPFVDIYSTDAIDCLRKLESIKQKII